MSSGANCQVSWTLRQALVVIILINLVEIIASLIIPKAVSFSEHFVFWSLLDVLLYVGGVVLFVKYKKKSSLRELGLHKNKLIKSIVYGIGTGLLTAVVVLVLGSLLVALLGKQPENQQVQEVASRAVAWWERGTFMFLTSLIIPFKEELVFRGFVYPAFRDRVGVFQGILLTSVFFSIAHGDLLRAIPLLIGGLALNLVYQRTGSLYSAIVAHGVWNAGMSILSFWG